MMDQSYSESDVSLSPSKILDRLQLLRQLQLLQRGKLQHQRIQYQNTPEITSSITEIVSHFSDSTSYNTFRSLLQSEDTSNDVSPRLNTNNFSTKENIHNIIDGISVLNISEESEFVANSPISTRSLDSIKGNNDKDQSSMNTKEIKQTRKQISIDDMLILSPKKDFETLISEKLKNDKRSGKEVEIELEKNKILKRPFLRRGEGTARFGIQKSDFVIQNTKSLPWRAKNVKFNSKTKINTINSKDKINKSDNVPIEKGLKESKLNKTSESNPKEDVEFQTVTEVKQPEKELIEQMSNHLNNNFTLNKKCKLVSANSPKDQSVKNCEGKTWAAVLTKEQDDFLRKLKQSEYYKNFASPAKSCESDISCNEDISRLKQEREIAEQKMFELLENKVCHESFSMQSSFFNRFLRNNNLECSGESTPLVMQKYISKNPKLLHILPDIDQRRRNNSYSDTDTCNSEYTECSENCSTLSSCCSCKTVTQTNLNVSCIENDQINKKGLSENVQTCEAKNNCKEKENNDNVTVENEIMNANMVEMNSKLIATSELLRDRLKELEDEIETFRKENANLTKMREEVDIERQKFYEEKSMFEQKFNEEKVLSEYYLAEEKEKLSKQKQIYERYVRDMRGRLNKKDKAEVTNLKKEIHDLKEEIKIKDAKSTSTIARLRNQMKIMEKDKKHLQEEIEKLKKENRRIQHSNEMTRRLTNIKYLEQINKKLSNMTSKDSKSEVELDSDIKYKSYEIERQSRAKKVQPVRKGMMKPRAKSVPNLHVTSRYAKYFSQKDSVSEREKHNMLDSYCAHISANNDNICNDSEGSSTSSESEDENKLEMIYNERFKYLSPTSSNKSNSSYFENAPKVSNRPSVTSNEFFIQKSTNDNKKESSVNGLSKYQPIDINPMTSKSPCFNNRLSNGSKSSLSLTNEDDYLTIYNHDSNFRTKSPVSILSNRSSSSQKSGTVINKHKDYDTLNPSPEPTSSKTSLAKTKLSPTEITKPDGSKELRFPNGNIKLISANGKYSKFIYYNGDVKENFYNEGRIKYYYAETKTYHTTHPDGLEVLEFPDGQVEKRYKDGSSEIRLPNGSIRYYDPKNEHVREEWRFPDGATLTVSANGDQRITFANGQVEVHAKDHKRREFPDGTVKLVYNDGTSETRYASGRIRIKDKQGNLIMDSASG
ncbi:unnamed protein product, partial [Brenthis ino]